MAISELSLMNSTLALIGSVRALTTTEDRKEVRTYNSIYEQGRNEMFGLPHDWKFATTRAKLKKLYQLTVDTAPTATVWVAGATLTGESSGTTCKVVSVVSTTVFLITEPLDSDGDSADFTDGEIISDGTNSVNCAANYPVVAEKTPVSGFAHQYVYPTNYSHMIALVESTGDATEYGYRKECYIDDADNEIDVLLTDETTVYIKYVRIRTDISTWSSWFAALVYTRNAVIMCEPLKQKFQKQNQLFMLYEEAEKKAIEANGWEDANTSSNVNVDKGNTDVVNAALNEELDKKYIINRSS